MIFQTFKEKFAVFLNKYRIQIYKQTHSEHFLSFMDRMETLYFRFKGDSPMRKLFFLFIQHIERNVIIDSKPVFLNGNIFRCRYFFKKVIFWICSKYYNMVTFDIFCNG